jgi:hypothetical protein
MLKRSCAILALTLVTSDLLVAQAVRGRLVEADSGAPVAGGLIVMFDLEGTEVASTVTGSQGTYHVRAPGAGVFRLRAERIGFESSLSGEIALLSGQVVTEELAASSTAIVLPVLTVESKTECRVRPEEGETTYVVWEEARKALAVTERTAAGYFFDATTYERTVDPWGGTLTAGETEHVSMAGRHPFRSAPIEDLEEHGYARRKPEGTYFYGPDAEVVLSDQFLDSHCFRSRLGDDDALVGLSFEPVVQGGDRVDVEGVLWLDRESSKLRTLEFRYTGVERPARGEGPGPHGEMVFDQLPGGGWIVREWWIRVPLGSQQRGVRTYVTYVQRGGRVRHTEQLGASRSEMAPVPSVYGPPPSSDSSGAP